MLDTSSLVFDTGLFILIWMVQLIIYPSFLYYERSNLIKWHNKYTGLIAVIVAPLMLGQLGSTVYAVIIDAQAVSIIKLILVAFIWIFTFVYFAPTHGKVSEGDYTEATLHQLVKLNWYRTIAWTCTFIISLYTTINF